MSATPAATPVVVEKQHITRTPGFCGGKPRIAGTRIRVWYVAVRTQAGETPDEILAAYPHLTLSQIYAALAYYYDHKAEIDEEAAEDDRFVEALRAEMGPGPMEQKKLEDEARGKELGL